MFIYKITNLINGKCYIGQTTRSIEIRFRFHCYNSKSRSLIRNAIKKYGKENFKIEILEEVGSVEELDFLEKYYIKFYESQKKGYNIQTGGAIRDSMLGKKHTLETRKKMSIKASGKNNSQYGKTKQLSPNFEVKKSKEHIEKIAAKHRKKVLCIELNKIFNSLKESAEYFNTRPSSIHNALNKTNRCKSYRGFHFKYVEEKNNGKSDK